MGTLTAARSPATSVADALPAATTIPSELVPQLRRFTVKEYHTLVQQGFFADDEAFELLRGYIVHKVSRDPIHDAVLEILAEMLRDRIPVGWRVRVQSAVTTSDSEPEPDIAVVRGRPQDHFDRHPSPSELCLAVEVANSTLVGDRVLKGPIYAESGVPVYWVVNVKERRVEAYTEPSGGAYRQRTHYKDGENVPLSIEGLSLPPIPVSDLFPPLA